VALEPLVRQRRLDVHEFILVEPKVALEVDARGRPNWIFTRPAATPAPQQPSRRGRVETFSLHGMKVIDGRFSYANYKTRSAYLLEDVDAKADLDGMDAPLNVAGEATWRGQRTTVDLSIGVFRALTTGQATPLKASLGSTPLNATLDGELDVRTGGVSGDVTASGPSLRGLADWAGNSLGKGPGLETFSVTGRLTVGPRRYAFENAAIEIDQVKGRGDFLIEQGPTKPYLSGRLEIPSLDLNPYLVARTEESGVQVATVSQVDVKAPGWSELPISISGIKAINANLELTTGPLQILKTTLDRTQISFVLLDGYLAATMPELQMYGGAGTGRFQIDARSPEIVIRNELAVQKVDAQRFFTAAFGFTNLEGAAKIDWGLSGKGTNQKQLMSSLSGTGNFTFQNGALRGVNLGGVSRTIRNALRGEMVSPTARTPFSSFTATIKASDGVLATNNLVMVTPDARINAIGVIDMGARALDMRLTPRLSGIAVPFRVSGGWTQIGYASDFLGRARPAIEARVRAVQAKAPAR
ncbi:MAG: AsmA family protein, partial [Alphaproteobacteria bacterium]|nr:AsmA family protein [Alphaproteobacteria bacterium]